MFGFLKRRKEAVPVDYASEWWHCTTGTPIRRSTRGHETGGRG